MSLSCRKVVNSQTMELCDAAAFVKLGVAQFPMCRQHWVEMLDAVIMLMTPARRGKKKRK